MISEIASTRGRPSGDHDEKRRQIAQATFAVIRRQGMDSTTMRAIAREAGCTTGVLSHYFANKDEIMAYALERLFDNLEKGVDTAFEMEDTVLALKAFIRSTLPAEDDAFSGLSVWQSYVSRAEHNERFANIFRRRHGAIRDRLAALIAQGQNKGLLRGDVDSRDLADQLNATLDGLLRMAPIEYERLPAKRLISLMDLQIDLITNHSKVNNL